MTNKLFGWIAGITLFALATLPAPAADRHALDTRVPEAATHLPMVARLPATSRMELSIGLPLRNQPALASLFHQIYDPGSTNFHRYLTPDQFTEQFGPAVQDYQSVLAYARANGLEITRTFTNRSLVDVAGNVSDIEGMFHVKMGTYQHPTENRQFYAPDVKPTVDASQPILFVSGLDNYFIPQRHGHRTHPEKARSLQPNGGSDPAHGLYMGNDFRNAYLPGTMLNGAGQIVGVFEPQGYNYGDVVAYENYAGLPNVLVTNVLNTYAISPGTNSGNDEVASDIELAIAMAPGLRQVNVYEGPTDSSMIGAMAESGGGAPPPNQISCSWGMEGDNGVEQGLITLALQGQSFNYAIGDGGAYANGVNTNYEPDLLYMTTVGGTQLFMTGSGTAWSGENVWNDDGPPTNSNYFASTGGVFNQVAIPDFQKGINMVNNQGSTQFRNVPDVALVARDIVIFFTSTPAKGPPVPAQYSGWVGTSAAAPLFTGLIALANQEAASQGKPPVGFINPAIYNIAEGKSYAACFHDITNGNNAWSNTSAGTSTGGLYNSVPGYDLCTGWGSIASTAFLDELCLFAGPVFVNFSYNGGTNNGTYAFPYKSMAQATNGVSPRGTVFIMNGGSTPETMTIAKPMTITSQDGAATIGN